MVIDGYCFGDQCIMYMNVEHLKTNIILHIKFRGSLITLDIQDWFLRLSQASESLRELFQMVT